MKRGFKFIMVVLAVLATVGCGKKETDKIEYTEAVQDIPDEFGIIFDSVSDEDKNLETMVGTDSFAGIYSYQNNWEQKNSSWNELQNSVLFNAKFLNQDKVFVALLHDALLAGSEDEANALKIKYFILGKDGSSEEVVLSNNTAQNYFESNLFTPYLFVDQNIIGTDNENNVYCFDLSGEMIYKTSCGESGSAIVDMIIIDGNIYAILNDGKVACLSEKSGERSEGNEKITTFLKYSEGPYDVRVEKDVIYKLSDQAMAKYDLKKDKESKLFDTEYMNLKNAYSYMILQADDDQFLISYVLEDGSLGVAKYEKGTVKSEAEEAVKIYSLSDNYPLMELVNGYNMEYPKNPVELEIGFTYDDATTKEDAIKKLNTQILASNGPDIIFMDGLDIEGYFAEDALMDLNTVVDEKSLKEYFGNLKSAYSEEDSLYGLPLGFVTYGMAGDSKSSLEFSNIDAMIQSLDTLKEKEAITDYNLAECANYVFLQKYDELFNDANELDVAKLTEVINEMKILYDSSFNPLDEEVLGENIFADYGITSMDSAAEWIYYSKVPFAAGTIPSYESLAAMKYLSKEMGYLNQLENSEDLIVKPMMVLSVSKNAKVTDSLKKFISYAIAEGQTNSANTKMAFPSNSSVLKNYMDAQNESYGKKPFEISEFGYGENPEMLSIYGEKLSEKEVDRLIDGLKNAKIVSFEEEKLQEIVCAEVSKYCKGEMSLEETIESIQVKSDILKNEK